MVPSTDVAQWISLPPLNPVFGFETRAVIPALHKSSICLRLALARTQNLIKINRRPRLEPKICQFTKRHPYRLKLNTQTFVQEPRQVHVAVEDAHEETVKPGETTQRDVVDVEHNGKLESRSCTNLISNKRPKGTKAQVK